MSIEIKELSHIYAEGLPDEQIALDKVSMTCRDDEIVSIIGRTGSGKSTLLQHMNGLLKPKSGSVIIDGVDITAPDIAMKDIRKKVGLVFQYPEYQLFEETVAKDVAFGPGNLGLDAGEIDARVREAIALVGLDYDEVAERSPFELSGGQKRRVAIAGVIAMKPKVLILDEPTAGLDPGSHKEILNMIRLVHKAEGNIIIFVSHNMTDVASMADKIFVLDKGRVLMSGTPREVFMRRDELIKNDLAAPPATELVARLRSKGLDISTNVINLDEATKSIESFLAGKMIPGGDTR